MREMGLASFDFLRRMMRRQPRLQDRQLMPAHLKRLPLHALKIDVSFVRQMLASPADGVIVDSTIALAHQLGLSVAAEGIEDAATLAVLRAHGCDEGQGYFIGYPMSANEAERWMRNSEYAPA